MREKDEGRQDLKLLLATVELVKEPTPENAVKAWRLALDAYSYWLETGACTREKAREDLAELFKQLEDLPARTEALAAEYEALRQEYRAFLQALEGPASRA